MTTRAVLTMLACTCALALVAVGCGGDDDSSSGGGLITADGSSTVGPFTTKAAEDWKAAGGGDVTVGISGTGGGFERFCVGETDISNASRRSTRTRRRSARRTASSTSSSGSRPMR